VSAHDPKMKSINNFIFELLIARLLYGITLITLFSKYLKTERGL
jgi:hypothetical protein